MYTLPQCSCTYRQLPKEYFFSPLSGALHKCIFEYQIISCLVIWYGQQSEISYSDNGPATKLSLDILQTSIRAFFLCNRIMDMISLLTFLHIWRFYYACVWTSTAHLAAGQTWGYPFWLQPAGKLSMYMLQRWTNCWAGACFLCETRLSTVKGKRDLPAEAVQNGWVWEIENTWLNKRSWNSRPCFKRDFLTTIIGGEIIFIDSMKMLRHSPWLIWISQINHGNTSFMLITLRLLSNRIYKFN